MMGLLHQIGTLRIQLAVLCSEVVVNGRALKDALLHSLALTHLVIPHLHDDTQALHEEDAAEYG